MKISIITATYNSEGFIMSNLNSVNSQTYKNYEHIIIDNESKDKTLDIIRNKNAQNIENNNLTNTHQIGKVMYTDYFFVFQLSGCILLVAMIGAIVLTLRKREGVLRQDITKQLDRRKEDSIEIIKVKNKNAN